MKALCLLSPFGLMGLVVALGEAAWKGSFWAWPVGACLFAGLWAICPSGNRGFRASRPAPSGLAPTGFNPTIAGEN
jgi:hypothetical protein